MADLEDALADLGERARRPGQPHRRRAPHAPLRRARRARSTGSTTRRRRWSCARAAGTSTRGTCPSTARRSRRRLFDFGLFFFHNAERLLERGSGPYFYLPKLESHLEARLWNDVFNVAQDALGIARGSIRATVLIETILAAFEMDEILYELRDHAAGLNAGRWDYIFSVIKKFARPGVRAAGPRAGHHGRAVHARLHGAAGADLPPARRARHRRHGRVHPQPPRRRGQRARAGQGARGQGARGGRRLRRHLGRAPRPRRRSRGRSSTPCSATAEPARRLRQDVDVEAAELLDVRIPAARSPGRPAHQRRRRRCSTSTPGCARHGAAAIHNLMEDAATAEISRAQLWQWVRHGARLDDGGDVVTPDVRPRVRESRSCVAEEGDAVGPRRRASCSSRSRSTTSSSS